MTSHNFSDRDRQLIDAAARLWAQYGLSRTTMADIASEAGVARQTLYNAYPNKEALLRATVQMFFSRTLEALTLEWAEADSLAPKIDAFFAHVPLAWFDFARSAPHAAEVMDGALKTEEDVIADGDAMMLEALTGVFEGTDDPAAMADFVYSTAVNAKKVAPSRAILEQRLAFLKASVLALVEPS